MNSRLDTLAAKVYNCFGSEQLQVITPQDKSALFAELGRAGAKARAKKLTKAERVRIATKASKAAAKARKRKVTRA